MYLQHHRCIVGEPAAAHLVVPGRDAIEAVILVQQVDGLTQETVRQHQVHISRTAVQVDTRPTFYDIIIIA